MRILIPSITALLLTGCVGVATIHDSLTRYTSPNIMINSTYPESCCKAGVHVSTKREVLEILGDPDSKWMEGTLEKYRYYRGLSWAVLVPWFIVPIPLGIPTGHSGVTFTFDGDTLVAADADETKSSFALCGIFINPSGHGSAATFGCGAGTQQH